MEGKTSWCFWPVRCDVWPGSSRVRELVTAIVFSVSRRAYLLHLSVTGAPGWMHLRQRCRGTGAGPPDARDSLLACSCWQSAAPALHGCGRALRWRDEMGVKGICEPIFSAKREQHNHWRRGEVRAPGQRDFITGDNSRGRALHCSRAGAGQRGTDCLVGCISCASEALNPGTGHQARASMLARMLLEGGCAVA